MVKDILRRCRFTPYRKGMGPVFSLTTWYTGRTGFGGKDMIGYKLTMTDNDPRKPLKARTVILFEGEDFGCSPTHAIDSDETVAGIMSFLTLRPGDTDAEYFADYTPEQLAYCEQHAEALACCVSDRFGER